MAEIKSTFDLGLLTYHCFLEYKKKKSVLRRILYKLSEEGTNEYIGKLVGHGRYWLPERIRKNNINPNDLVKIYEIFKKNGINPKVLIQDVIIAADEIRFSYTSIGKELMKGGILGDKDDNKS